MKANILIVEDERLVARELRLRLEEQGYRVLASVATADDALTAASQQTPDLVLMDIRIQGTRDGIEAAGLLQQRFDVPVVFLTAHSDDATVERAKRIGAAGYLIKPPKERELIVAIEVALHRHEMARQLRRRERWFSTTLRSIGDAVVSTDPDGTVSFMNPVAELLTGWRAEDARGQPLSAIVRIVRTPAADDTLTDSAGREHAISDTTAPITDDTGALLGSVLVFKDVTQQRQLERQLEAAERLASLGTLAAGVAHEINNPLTWIIANLESIREVIEQTEVTSALGGLCDEVGDALKGADRIRRIVRDLSVFSQRTPEREVCHVADAVRQAVANASSPIAIALELVDARVAMAESRLAQILANLLSNAVDAIAAAPGRDHRISIRSWVDGKVARIEVLDTGIGIEVAARRRIFEPFFTTKSTGKGTGLGLSIAHGLVTAAGGTIAVRSSVGEGSTFTFEIPLATPAVTPTAPEPAPGARSRVLVIDDEEVIRRLIRRMLRQHDVTTLTAPEALERMRSGDRFDVILCDLMMPEITGMDLYEQVLALDPAQARRIVFLTGGAFSIRSAEFIASTTNPVLNKPFTPAELQALVLELAAKPS